VKETDKEALAGCGLLSIHTLAVTVFPALEFVINGLVLIQLWKWLIVETFAMPPLTLLQAVGLSLVVSFLTYSHVDVKSPERDKWELFFYILGGLTVRPIFTVVAGFIVYQLM